MLRNKTISEINKSKPALYFPLILKITKHLSRVEPELVVLLYVLWFFF